MAFWPDRKDGGGGGRVTPYTFLTNGGVLGVGSGRECGVRGKKPVVVNYQNPRKGN